MVSTAMQGGCTCENASLLRIDTGNVEFAALFAPKPLGMTAADDWTKEMPTKGFPELKSHYAMMGAPDGVLLKPLLHFGHNYNYVSRAAMYAWLNKHFSLGLKEPIVEEDYHRLNTAEMSVWDENNPKPEGGPEFEKKLLRHLTETAETQLQPACDSLDHYHQIVGGAMDVIIGRNLSDVGELELKEVKNSDRSGYEETTGLLLNTTHGEEIPFLVLRPHNAGNRTVIWIDERGKAGLFEGQGPAAAVQQLLSAGITVIGADLLFQGEFLSDNKPVTRTRRVSNPREFGGYTFGYNRTLFAQRVHDILSVIKQVKQAHQGELMLVGFGGAGPLAAVATAQAQGAIAGVAIDTGGFRFGKVLDLQDINFLPGGAKYWDLPGILALCAPTKLGLVGEGDQAPEVVRTLYSKANAQPALRAFNGNPAQSRQAALEFVLKGT